MPLNASTNPPKEIAPTDMECQGTSELEIFPWHSHPISTSPLHPSQCPGLATLANQQCRWAHSSARYRSSTGRLRFPGFGGWDGLVAKTGNPKTGTSRQIKVLCFCWCFWVVIDQHSCTKHDLYRTQKACCKPHIIKHPKNSKNQNYDGCYVYHPQIRFVISLHDYIHGAFLKWCHHGLQY